MTRMESDAALASQCNLCSHRGAAPLFSTFNMHGRHVIDPNETFSLVRCGGCGVCYLRDIVVDSDYYQKYYELGYYNSDIPPASFLARALAVLGKCSMWFKERMILKYFTGEGRVSLLDVGCGGGVFLSALNSSRFDKCGVEINKEGYELCQRKGLAVYNKSLAEAKLPEKSFSVVTLWHVLEHVDKPKEIFEVAHKILADDGVVVIQVPNMESLGFKYGRQRWFHLDSPRHLMLYNKKSMEKLCELTGFQVIEVRNEFYDYPQDLFWSVRNSPAKYWIYPFYPMLRMLSAEHLTFVLRKR